MRRLFVILLLLILPFQATLAAVDLCCSYDRGVRHQPCASEPAAAQPATDKVVNGNTIDGNPVDIHCALCFLASVGMMPAPAAPTVPVRTDSQTVADAAPPTWSSLHSPRPERPQWRVAA